MSVTSIHLFILSMAWLSYFLLHSLLASLSVKQWVTAKRPELTPIYRLLYNVLAVALLIIPLGLTLLWREQPLWEWKGIWGWFAKLAMLAAVVGFLWTLRYYDSKAFLGLRQWRRGKKTVEDQECFRISPLHRYVRHPWYSLGLVVLWTQDMDPSLLLTSAVITLYCIVGSRLEENKLLSCYGGVYRQYREQVPGLIPLPWKSLSKKAAAELIASAERAGKI